MYLFITLIEIRACVAITLLIIVVLILMLINKVFTVISSVMSVLIWFTGSLSPRCLLY